MKITYDVHSVSEEEIPLPGLKHGNRAVSASVTGLVVELVDGDSHGHTWRFAPTDDADFEDLKALFSGQKVVVSFEAA